MPDANRSFVVEPTADSLAFIDSFRDGSASREWTVSANVAAQALHRAQISIPRDSAKAKFLAAITMVSRASRDFRGKPQHPKNSRSWKCIPKARAVSLADTS